MKSSKPVFTRQNPIPPASTVRRAHYHPSCNQSLSKKEKQTTLSPVRPSQSSSQQRRPLNRERKQLHDSHDDDYTDGPVFTEIWPTIGYESSPESNNASLEMMACRLSARPDTPPASSGVQDDSVLAKYIERFRHGQPQSREERQQVAGEDQAPFWWMSHSSVPGSTMTKAAAENYGCDSASYSGAGQHQRDRPLSVLSDSSQGEFNDTEILHLQEKANMLLLRGECVQSDGSIPVSSDGLGCSDFSSPVSFEKPVRQPLIKPAAGSVSADPVHAASSQKSIIPTLAPAKRPEEDILFQWRLRRKMEQAREWSQSKPHSSYPESSFSWQAPSLTHPSTSQQPYMQHQSSQPSQFPQRDAHPNTTAPQSDITKSHRLPDPSPSPFPAAVVSGSSSSQPQVFAHVPAHMHLLCDILPCPIQSSHAEGKQSFSHRLDEPQTKGLHKKIQVPESSSHEGKMSSSLHVSSRTAEREMHSHQKVPEKNKSKRLESEKKTALSTRQQRKSTRSSSHQSLPRKVASSRERHQQEGILEFPTESCSRDHEPPPSPVHAALGQVVSEVLFPVARSSPAQKVSRVSLPHTVSSSSQSPLPSCSTQNSLEVISQLLQEAEDSDEAEFEDDPLLKVLRQQRKWVKDHISEVDLMLNESLEEQQVT